MNRGKKGRKTTMADLVDIAFVGMLMDMLVAVPVVMVALVVKEEKSKFRWDFRKKERDEPRSIPVCDHARGQDHGPNRPSDHGPSDHCDHHAS